MAATTAKTEPTGGRPRQHSDGANLGTGDQVPSLGDEHPGPSDGISPSETVGPADPDTAVVAEETRDPQRDAEAKPKKRKGKKKKTGAASRKNVTGFEGKYPFPSRPQFFADAPMTPDEAANENNIYDSSRSFAVRIEECIQRYRASRRMDNERSVLFDKYLWLGGIDSSPRQFTGAAEDAEALAEADADQIRKMTAVDFVGGNDERFYNSQNSGDWFVDFEGIVRGFLSRTVLSMYLYDEKAIKMAADLVKNFLNYVLVHNACPEYLDDLMAARNICSIAPMELRSTIELFRSLPGAFNTAARSLFCDRRVDNLEVAENFDRLVTFRVATLVSPYRNQEIAANIAKIEDPSTIHVVSTKEETYEVLEILRPTDRGIITLVKEQLEQSGHGGKGELAGVLKVKPSAIEFGFDNMPTVDEINLSKTEPEEFLLENDLLVKFEKGMKIKAIVCELNVGIRFIKEVLDVRASFDLLLPQALMENWKDPVPNERPAPSATSAEAGEEAMDDDGDD
ncbi:Argonaute siRNA chaperone complex subunit Arb1-domain-containing protein [Durotheca rogersii]|uniref:Argonaute siRNA chaperone complex subunit Arb1-domain-containing protein n=1 Tax=Durotheca rogersii TaxID=419775 RepID=UPI002220AFD6|nr:Argonaute siRNA chaperone complex subunit Arb1-domain-containing protein [Durotheca rogersii]KAI5868373.1 Argonaute siRNA chaperone complex subunit Arb1-domain-containing protein [Durotheca rogersii]